MSEKEKRNIRQEERRARLQNMIIEAVQETFRLKRTLNITKIHIETFLAQFRIRSGSGLYASQNYFKDFVQCEVFIEDGDTFQITTNLDFLAYYGQYYPILLTYKKKLEEEKPKEEVI